MMIGWRSSALELGKNKFFSVQAAEYMEKILNTLPFSSQSTQDFGWKSSFHILIPGRGSLKK